MMVSGSNTPFKPRTVTSAALFKTNRCVPPVASKMKVLSSGGTFFGDARRPWRGKSERREVIRNRRQDRELAEANKQP